MRLAIGISGASGAIYGVRLLEVLKTQVPEVETHLVISPEGEQTIRLETGRTLDEVRALASRVWGFNDQMAALASGSFRSEGMIIIPCSMKTVAGIASGYADNLLLRSADVCLKEGRRLVLVPRETPVNAIHLENMLKLSRIGVTMLLASPPFYQRPKQIEELVDYIVGKALDPFGIEHNLFKRWREPEK